MRFWSDRYKEPKKKNESCITESQQLQKIISGFRVGSVNDGRINGIDYRIPSRIMSFSDPLTPHRKKWTGPRTLHSSPDEKDTKVLGDYFA